MRDVARLMIMIIINNLSGESPRYDIDVGNGVIEEIEKQNLNTNDALKYICDRIAVNHAGCHLNWAGALAYQLHVTGRKAGLLITPKDGVNKISVVYRICDELYVADIVKYIKDGASLSDICGIPYNDFVKQYGENVYLFDVEKISGPFLDSIKADPLKSNVKPEDFLTDW